MPTLRRFLPDPPGLAFEDGGELCGVIAIFPAAQDGDIRTRMIELGKALGPHAPEDRELELFLGKLPDGRLAIVPDPPYAGASYAIEAAL